MQEPTDVVPLIDHSSKVQERSDSVSEPVRETNAPPAPENKKVGSRTLPLREHRASPSGSGLMTSTMPKGRYDCRGIAKPTRPSPLRHVQSVNASVSAH